MLTERKRGKWFYIEGRIVGERVRLALRTQNRDNARSTISEIERALAAGAESELWPKLKAVLPEKSFESLAAIAGYAERLSIPAPSWEALAGLFESDALRRIALGNFRDTTWARYKFEMKEFGEFVAANSIVALAQIDRAMIEQWKVWRVARIRSRSKMGAAKSLALCAAILHRVFQFAIENEMAVKNPVRLEGRPGENPERGSQPFRPDEIRKLREHAGSDALAFALLRWTGFRGSDAVALTWAEVDFDLQEIVRVTRKRNKRVVVPIHTELLFALEAERDRRSPQPWDRVLLNPETGEPLTRMRLYNRMLALGRRAGVAGSNPHRFRDSLAVEMLVRGATPYDVAKLLGDTIDTVEKHYAPFVPELRERVRRIMELQPDAENMGTIRAQLKTKNAQVQ
ncbi:MAG TPA: site-specific integrase [Candidatus Acidoferrales bacterium]|nr:site-specific integrase [Candidatus Acidoferrales bacterium]